MRTIPFRPMVGTDIYDACHEARALAKKHRIPVRFRFNDTTLIATRKRSVDSLVREFKAPMHDWPHSKAGRASAERDHEDIRRCQVEIDRLIADIGAISPTHEVVLKWLCEYQPVSDRIGTNGHFDFVVGKLKSFGYQTSFGVGDPEHMRTQEWMARYIVGQAISCMEKGLPPHAILITFVERYFA